MHAILNSSIQIGKLKPIIGVNDVVIHESVKDYVNTCVIKLPPSALMKNLGTQIFESVQTARQIKVGDEVIVSLGYNGVLRKEFVGFVTQPNLTTPAQIECEGFSYLLRKKKNIKASWGETDLVTVLKKVVDGTGIKIHPKTPAIPLLNLVINNASGIQVLDYLKDLLKGTITFCFIEDVLYGGLTYIDIAEKTVKYIEGWNTIDANALKFHRAEDVAVKIEFKFKGGDALSRDPVIEGTGDGIVRRDTVSVTDSPKWLKEMAKAKLLQETYNGYEGSINAFLVPYCRAGYRIEYKSPHFKERSGVYFCAGVTTTFGMGGARRVPELDLKLSNL